MADQRRFIGAKSLQIADVSVIKIGTNPAMNEAFRIEQNLSGLTASPLPWTKYFEMELYRVENASQSLFWVF